MPFELLVDVVIPALNEEESIGKVIRDLPSNIIRNTVVCDNGSTDHTAQKAKEAGAIVVQSKERGYGIACLTALSYIADTSPLPDAVLFIDADYSDFPEEAALLIQTLQEGANDLVIGSRVLGKREGGSLTIPQLFGNKLATFLMRVFYGGKFTDLGPFRIIRYDALMSMNMKDRNYGWTVEMQIKALQHKLRYAEIPVSYRNRIGKSKVSGTVKGTILAGYKILLTIFKYSRQRD